MDFLAGYDDDNESDDGKVTKQDNESPYKSINSTSSFLERIRNSNQDQGAKTEGIPEVLANLSNKNTLSQSESSQIADVVNDNDGNNEDDENLDEPDNVESFDNEEIETEYGDSSDESDAELDVSINQNNKQESTVFESSEDIFKTIPIKRKDLENKTKDQEMTDQQEGPFGEDDIESYATKFKIPISHQVDLGGHEKAVMCFSCEPSGNRVVTGSLDYTFKLYDFGGMDSRHRSFRGAEPDNSHPVTCLSHSPQGDRFVVGTGSAQCIIYDRECVQIIKFAKGDMYIRDLIHTKGHTMEVSGVQWHPVEKNIILTASLDGSLRIWDLLGEAHFGHLTSKYVLKLRGVTGQQGQGRLAATACCFTPNGSKIIGGAADGSIHIWLANRKQFTRTDWTIRPAHTLNSPVTWLTVASDNNTLASRSGASSDARVLVWNIIKITSSSSSSSSTTSGTTSINSILPMLELPNLPNDYPTANVDFSPDGKFLCCGTTPIKRKTTTSTTNTATSSSSSLLSGKHAQPSADSSSVTDGMSHSSGSGVSSSSNDDDDNSTSSFLYFYNIDTAIQTYQKAVGQQTSKSTSSSSSSFNSQLPLRLQPNLKITVARGVSAIMVKWQPKTNQIFCSTSGGYVRTFFDPRFSVKGALITSSRAPKRVMDPADFLLLDSSNVAGCVGEIINPNALPMYRNDTRITKNKDVKDLAKAKVPLKPDESSTVIGGQKRANTSFFFTQFVMQNRSKDLSRSEDPREALLKLDSLAKSDPMFLGKAYAESQPKTKLAELTFEQEQEEFKKRQKRVI